MSGSESESEGVIRNGKSASLAPSLADPATSGERGNEQVSSFNILKHSLAAEVKSIHEATRTVRHLASFSSALQDTSSVLHVNVLCTWLTRYTHLAPCNTINNKQYRPYLVSRPRTPTTPTTRPTGICPCSSQASCTTTTTVTLTSPTPYHNENQP